MTDTTIGQISLIYRGETQQFTKVSQAVRFLRQARIKVGWFHTIKTAVDLIGDGNVSETRHLKGDKYVMMMALEQLESDLKGSNAQTEYAIHAANHFAENLVETLREPLVVLDAKLRIVLANQAFYRAFKVSRTDTEHCLFYELGNQQWNIPALRVLLEEILPANTHFDDFEVDHTFPHIGRRVMLLNARRVLHTDIETALILLAIEDITERQQAEEERRRLEDQLRQTQNVEIDVAFATAHPPLHAGPHVRATASDTGEGIAPDVLEHIFEPFFTTKGVGEGTGMGLAIVHGLVASHGGAITVESSPDRGTTFAIYLPQMTSGAAHDAKSEPPLPRGQGGVLFVDDDAPVALAMQLLLESLGYDVVAHTTSQGALGTFQIDPHRFDVVITDQTMPQMTGAQLACEVHRVRSDMPVILCTGFSHVMDAAQAQALGIEAFLPKPVEEDELVATIQKVVAQRLAPGH